MDQLSYKKRDVAASLEFGCNASSVSLFVFWSGIIVGIILLLVYILYLNDPIPKEQFIIIFIPIWALVVIIPSACVLIRQYIIDIKLDVWLKDAVPLRAKCQGMGKGPECIRFTPSGYKILVKFRYNGKRYTKYSGKKKEGVFMTVGGFSTMYSQYIDKEVDILYSPKYDQVMLLRLPKKRTKRKNKDANI